MASWSDTPWADRSSEISSDLSAVKRTSSVRLLRAEGSKRQCVFVIVSLRTNL